VEPQPAPFQSGAMDGGQVRAHMEDADGRAAEAERLANQQRALVGALARNGHDAGEARRLLRILEERLALEEAERDRMRRELVALKRREG
jgi:hypothetical protein